MSIGIYSRNHPDEFFWILIYSKYMIPSTLIFYEQEVNFNIVISNNLKTINIIQ